MAKNRHGPAFWPAIGIVACIVLFLFLIFFASDFGYLPTSGCETPNEFSCLSFNIGSANSTISFQFQYQGSNTVLYYNMQLACTENISKGGSPVPSDVFQSASSLSNTTLPAGPSNSVELGPGQNFTVNNLRCYSPAGPYLKPVSGGVGAYIWINYTSNPGSENAVTNPWVTEVIGMAFVRKN